MAQLQRIPFAPALLLQNFPPPHHLSTLQRAAEALGLKAGYRKVLATDLQRVALPCLAVIGPARPAETSAQQDSGAAGGEEPPPPSAMCGLALVLRADNDRVLLLEENRQTPVTLSIQEFVSRYAGTVLLFAAGPDTPLGEDGSRRITREFGFRWFIPELLKHKPIWRDVLLASFAIQLMALATPLFTQVMIDKVIVHHTFNTLIVIGVALAIIMLFSAVMAWLRHYLVLHTGNRIDAVLGTRVVERALELPVRYYDVRPTGTTVARLQGVETIREFISGAAVMLILDLPFLLIFLAIMYYYSPLLTLVAVVMLTLIVTVSAIVTPVLRRRLNEQFLRGARTQALLTEYFSGIETVKSLQMEPQVKARYGGYLASYLRASFDARLLANTNNVAANALEQLLTLLILCVGAWLVMTSDGFTIGMLVAFQMFAGRLSQPVLRLVGLWLQFQQAVIAVRRLGDIMNAPAEPYSVVSAREVVGNGGIEIAGLSFRYGDNLPYIIRNLDLRIRFGSCVALTGPSGCGKSTLAKLLQGFYSATDGRILIDNRDIRNLSANELRQNFGVVPQETVLFSGTIYDNLILANPLASFEQIIQACRMAEVHDTIEQLPDGYRTEIGEHGAGLSGGQKQRIAIARALLKQPKILIFDEATSSLDDETARQFAQTVNQLRGRITMLFITHKIPDGLAVDEVVCMAGSRIDANARSVDNHVDNGPGRDGAFRN